MRRKVKNISAKMLAMTGQYAPLINNYKYVFVLKILQTLINFLTFYFVVRYVPKEDLGHYQFVLSLISMLSFFSMTGMQAALLQNIARGKGGLYKIATKYCVTGSSAASGIMLLVAAYYLFVEKDTAVSFYVLMGAMLNPIYKGLVQWKVSFKAREKFRNILLVDGSSSLLISAMIIGCIFMGEGNAFTILLLSLIVPSIQNIIFWVFEYNRYKNITEDDLPEYTEYGTKTSVYNVLPSVAQEIDRMMIYNFLNPVQLAAYNVAMKIPELIKTFIQDLGETLAPRFSKMAKVSENLNKHFNLFSIVSFVVITGFAFTLYPFVFNLITSGRFPESLLLSQALMVSVAIGNTAILRSKYIKSQRDIQSAKTIMVMNSSIKIMLVVVLVPFIGVWGAVASSFIQRIVTSIYAYTIIEKKYR